MTDPSSTDTSTLHACEGPERAASVLAVVVTYHPPPELAAHLRAIRRQVGALVVVDNGSPDAARTAALCAELGAGFIGNAQNEGIARALNQGVERARQGGYRWLATFDQDSALPEGMVAGLLALAQRQPDTARVGIVGPSIHDRHLGRTYHDPSNTLADGPGWREVRVLITSGSLVNVASFDAVGGYDERLFIDFVDHDHCHRLRRAGWQLLQSETVVVDHAIGQLTTHRFLGRTVHCTNHSPERRYYITRNQLEYYRHCAVDEPRLALAGVVHLALRSLLTVLFEEQRMAKARAIGRGVWHFLTRRFGRL